VRPGAHARRAALTTALLAGLCGVAVAAPPPIAPGERPAAGSTEAELWYGMERAEQELRALPQIERDPALDAYVQGVLCRVAGEHCADLRLYLVDVPEFNASMAPNGATLVFTGALLRIRDEGELAVLLGHEFAHYRQRHSLQQWQSTKRSSAALGTFGVVTLGAGVGLVGSLAQLGGLAGLSSFSRDHEREADALGFDFATAQGYDANAGLAMWQRLAREEAATVGYRRNPVFASHPRTAERVEDSARFAASASVGRGAAPVDTATARQRHQAAIEPFLERWLAQELTRRRYAASIAMLGELHDAAPAGWRGRTAHALGEAYRLRRGEGDAGKAAALFAEAASAPDAPAGAFREHGYALRSAGDGTGARAALERYLSLEPEAPDRAFVERDLKDLSP
jgi:predicted Zn-dependent protease